MPAAKCLDNFNFNENEGPLFTLEERKLLLQKASQYFYGGSPALLHAIYRNKPKEYFDQIRAKAKFTGADEVMEGYCKNATGHEQNGINWNLKGTFFQLSLVMGISHNGHMVILVLCQRGTTAEQECRGNLRLLELNLFDNPFLRATCRETTPLSFMPSFIKQTYTYSVATTANDDLINIFHAGDFNISRALKARKCRFTTNHPTSDHCYAERRGLQLDKKCQICNIFPSKEQKAMKSLLPLRAIGKWRLWTFICQDLPQHACQRVNSRNAKILRPFDQEVEKICQKHIELPHVSSSDRWQKYISRGKCFQNATQMVECVRAKSCLLPSTLSRYVFFDKQFGMALFRDGITPDYDCPKNAKGGYFRLRLYARKNGHIWLTRLDQKFHEFADFIVNRLPPGMGQMVNGIFVRCEIAHCYKPEDSQNDYEAIAILIKIELWIRDKAHKDAFSHALAKWSPDARFTDFKLKIFK